MGNKNVFFKDDVKEYFFTQEGCFIAEIMNTPLNEDLSIARARVKPGDATELHSLHGTTEIYYVLEGRGEVTVGDQNIFVGVGDCVYIPPEIPQKIQNLGGTDLIFLCICQPRFERDNYVNL